MRVNQPVTAHEFALPEGATLLSTTDLDSRITYANGAFIAASGFSRAEITGELHNIVRHPDMPPEAFADMWATLQAGESWTALVKNRRKNGDHYWVRANAAPMHRGGRLVGYLSVRTAPARAEIDAAQALYERMRGGQARGWRLHKGVLMRRGLLAPLSWAAWLPVRWRLRAAGLATTAVSLGALAAVSPPQPLLWGAMAAAALTGAVVFAWLEHTVAAPLARIRQQALAVAAGALAEPVATGRVDEIGMIARAVNQAGLNVRSLVDDVGTQVGGLSTASAEIAAGSSDLSARTEQSAASLEETASSMEQLHSTVQHSASAATQAAQLAVDARHAAEAGGGVVSRVTTTMDEIVASSRRIADIINVIDGIAFQTNILALNAAVEAARAGEQGRGFAVVAAEVRQLAQRSANAAREIKQLITESVERVQTGTALVGDAGKSMDEIVAQVRRVDQLIAEISRATAEQTAGVGQVSGAVTQLDQSTQQNAALVEQSAAAAASLRDQAVLLNETVAVFR